MNNDLHIIQHSGLGDHLLCNGIIRTLAPQYEKIYLNVTKSTEANVRFMYRDLDNIEYYELFYPGYEEYMKEHPDYNYKVIGCTVEYFNKISSKQYRTFDQGFYAVAGIPYNYRWDKFYFQRDLESEMSAYQKLGLNENSKYIFVHEDPARGRLLDNNFLPKNITVIRTHEHKDIKAFDFLYTIEKAKEIHVIDSCFLALIDNMKINHKNKVIHNYGCNGVVFPTPVKTMWILITDTKTEKNEMYCNYHNL